MRKGENALLWHRRTEIQARIQDSEIIRVLQSLQMLHGMGILSDRDIGKGSWKQGYSGSSQSEKGLLLCCHRERCCRLRQGIGMVLFILVL